MPFLIHERRQFLKAGLAVAGCFALGRDFWKRAYAAPATLGASPYGALLPPDANGLELPQGFSSRKLATAYQPVLKANGSSTGYVWPRAPDGGGVIPQANGGWIYVSNSEIPIVADECTSNPTSDFCGEQGGCSAIAFDKDGQVLNAYAILQGTNNNCAGGVTPWGTWLSCEENFAGFVYECDPTGLNQPLRLPAMGQFSHEAAAVDPIGKAIYLTEDTADGAFYRFRPANWPTHGRPDLRVGTLEVAVVGSNPPTRIPYGSSIQIPGLDPDDQPIPAEIVESNPGAVTWQVVANPAGAPVECRYQVPTAAVFKGGEGCWYDDGLVFFTCKGSNRVWAYDTVAATMEIVYDPSAVGASTPLTGVDNLVVHADSRDLFIAEDGGNMEVVLITHESRELSPFLRYSVPHSEVCGVAFDPSGTRLYFASQAKRHRVDTATGKTVFGEIFEVRGPFRGTALAIPTDPTVPATVPTPATVPMPTSVTTPVSSPTPLRNAGLPKRDVGRFGGGALEGISVALLALAAWWRALS
jgi:hypothetical protein